MAAPEPAARLPALALALGRVVGEAHVSADVAPHLTDVTEHPPGIADLVVRPGTADEVQAVLSVCHEHGVPVTPVVANYNVAGIAIPRRGGVVLDLRRLDRILEVDTDAMYVLLEPA